MVVISRVRTRRRLDIPAEPLPESAGGLGVGGKAVSADKQPHARRDGCQRLVVGQVPLVGSELNTERRPELALMRSRRSGASLFQASSPATYRHQGSVAASGPPVSMADRIRALSGARTASRSSRNANNARLVQDRSPHRRGMTGQQTQRESCAAAGTADDGPRVSCHKKDVLPGRYTSLWFKATETGTFHLFCGQYCGTNHSQMIGWVYVMTPTDYAEWLAGGEQTVSMAQQGERLFSQFGCGTCHVSGSNGRGPSLAGIYGKPEKLASGQTDDDEGLIRQAIVNPNSVRVPGYEAIMPTYQGQIDEEQVLQLIAYVKSLGSEERTNGQ